MPERRFHAHHWSVWGDWEYAGSGRDKRNRRCMDLGCGAIGDQARSHRHGDKYTEVVRGVKVRRCGRCGATL